MCLWNAVFSGRITRVSLFGDKLALTSNAALQLRLNFSTTTLFEWIGATAGERCAADQEQDRQGPHPLILGMKLAKANRVVAVFAAANTQLNKQALAAASASE
jgi:hypothetical protein